MSCGWVWAKVCDRHACSPCAARIRRRNARVVGTGIRHQAATGKRLWLLTLTAPGEREHGRWSPAPFYVRGVRRPACACHEGVELEDWNPRAGACWNRLRTSLTARFGRVEFYRAAEVQDGKRGGSGRGALHHHVVLAVDGVPNVLEVQALALAAGYGCVIDLRAVEDVSAAEDVAGYVSKTLAGYVAKSSGGARLEVPWRADVADPDTGEVRRLRTVPTYNTHSQSRGWGCTVKAVKAANRDQARRRAAVLAALHGRPDAPPDPGGCSEPLVAADVGPPT